MEIVEDNFEKANMEFGKILGIQIEFHWSCQAGQ